MALLIVAVILLMGLLFCVVVGVLLVMWVFKLFKTSGEQSRAKAGLGNPNTDVRTPTSDEGRATRGGGGSEGRPVGGGPANLSVSDHAEREKARQQYAERAERLRAQRLGKPMPGGSVSQTSQTASSERNRDDEGWTTTPSPARPQTQSQSQAPMAQSRPLPSQQAKALPSNMSPRQTAATQSAPPARASASAPMKKAATRQASGPEAIIPGAPAGVGIGEESPQQQRARGGQSKAPQQQAAAAVKATSQAPVQHTLGRIGTIEDLRRAVVLREILDPPVSLRE